MFSLRNKSYLILRTKSVLRTTNRKLNDLYDKLSTNSMYQTPRVRKP